MRAAFRFGFDGTLTPERGRVLSYASSLAACFDGALAQFRAQSRGALVVVSCDDAFVTTPRRETSVALTMRVQKC